MGASGADLNPLNSPSEGELLGADLGPNSMPGKGKKVTALRKKDGTRIQFPAKTRYMILKGQLDTDRQSWRAHWVQLKRNFLPYRTRWIDDSGEVNKGLRKDQYIIDNTPPLAIRTCSAGLMSGVTNPSRPWIRIKPSDRALYAMPGVAEWCEALTFAVLKQLERSNFYQAMEPEYREITTFGTMAIGCYEVERDPRFPERPVVNFVPYTTGEYWIAQNSEGRVDVFMRQFKWTASQIVKRFVSDPEDPNCPDWANISRQVIALWRNRTSQQRVVLYQVIEPNTDYLPGALGAQGFPTRSVFFEEGGETEKLLEVSGYRSMPVHVVRWDLNSDDCYGHSPAMECLGDAKSLQKQQLRKAQAIDKQVDPPLLGDSNLKKTRVSQLPGEVTWLEGAAVNSYGMKPLYEVKPDMSGLLEDVQEIQNRIKAACYADVFQMLKSMGDQLKSGITATEISARQQERLLELGPLLNRMNSEGFNPIVDQQIEIIFRRSKLAWQHMKRYGSIPAGMEMIVPPPPAALTKVRLEVEYVSILSQAMRMSEIQSMQQLTTYVLSMAQTVPEVLDKINFDNGIDIIADRMNVPPEFIVSTEQANKVRDIRAKQKAQQAAQERAQAAIQVGAQAVKNLGQAPLGGSNALEQLMTGQMAGNA